MAVPHSSLLGVVALCLAAGRSVALRSAGARHADRPEIHDDSIPNKGQVWGDLKEKLSDALTAAKDKRDSPFSDIGWEEGGEGADFIQEAKEMHVGFYYGNFSGRVAEAFGRMQGPAVLTVTYGVTDLLVNFYLNVEKASKRANKTTNAANAAHTVDAMRMCDYMKSALPHVNLQCINLIGWLPGSLGDKARRGAALWSKPVIFNEAVKASKHGVLMTDIDVVFHQDLLGRLDTQWKGKDMAQTVLMTGTEWQTCCNSGTVYAKSDRSLPFLEQWVKNNDKFFRYKLGDQSALIHTIVFDAHALDLKWGFKLPFPQDREGFLDYIPGYKPNRTFTFSNDVPHPPVWNIVPVPENVVLEQCRKVRNEDPWAIHYNCINTHVNAQHMLSSHGNWSDEVEKMERSAQRVKMVEEHDWCDPIEFGLSPEGLPYDAGDDTAAPRGGIWNRERPEGTVA